jgi:hypothetical protein
MPEQPCRASLVTLHFILGEGTPHPVFEELGFQSFEEHPRADYCTTPRIPPCTMLIPTHE